MTARDVVRLEETPEALILHFDRPPVNAVDLGVVHALQAALRSVAACPPALPLVITGTGRCFSAGLDLKAVPRYGREQQREMIGIVNRSVGELYGLPRPTVAAINGHALAAGLVLVLTCDYRVATSAPCRLGLPEVNAGVPYPAVPLVVVREELSPAAARVLVLSGQSFDPDQARAAGVVDELVPPERVLPRALEQAAAMAAFPAYGRIKAQYRAQPLAAIARIVAENDDPLLATWI